MVEKSVEINRLGDGYRLVFKTQGETPEPCYEVKVRETKEGALKEIDKFFTEQRKPRKRPENIDPRGEAPFGAPGSGRVV